MWKTEIHQLSWLHSAESRLLRRKHEYLLKEILRD